MLLLLLAHLVRFATESYDVRHFERNRAMRKRVRWALGISFGLFIIALAWVAIQYKIETRRTQAQLDQFVNEAQARKLVKVDFVVTPPADTPKDQPLYLSGSALELGNWDAASLPLQRGDDGKYRGSA